MSPVQVNRQRLVAQTNCQFLEPSEFVERATSRIELLRANNAEADVQGLRDPQSGACFYVENEKLAEWRHTS